MLTLGIETSCDETGLALVNKGELVAHVMVSQVDWHSLFGGVVPEIASRAHLEVLPSLLETLLQRAGCILQDLEGIAVTRGPGLLASLLIGLGFAKGLSLGLHVPLVGVDHLQAHLLAAEMQQEVEYPCLGLLVSGGHTHLYLIKSWQEFILLGRTLDDALGEAFDKVAKMLNLPYPGGVFLDKLAREGKVDKELFPRPYIDNTNLDFSFSGIKTAVANYLQKNKHLVFLGLKEDLKLDVVSQELKDMCASLTYSLVEALKIKVSRALKSHPVKGLILAGGVAANSILRKEFSLFLEQKNLKFWVPNKELCTDNGIMVAYLGEKLLQAGYKHGLEVDAIPRGRIVPRDYKIN